MPIIRIEMLEGRAQETKQQIAKEMTEVLVRHLAADPSHIYVMFSDVGHHDWAVGGRFFDLPAPASAHRKTKP